MYNFLVLNKLYVEDGPQEKMTFIDSQKQPYVVLSILSPEWGLNGVQLPKELIFCKAHKTFLFHDVTERGDVNSLKPVTLPIVPISEVHAKEIIDFVFKWKDRVNQFIIHCEAGLSRSPAVALALSEILNGSETKFANFIETLYDINQHNISVKQKILTTYKEEYEKA